MVPNQINVDQVDPLAIAFSPLIGKPAWQVKRGYGSFLTLEFGEPHLTIREPMPDASSPVLHRRNVYIRGDWHLWIYCCNWRIRSAGKTIARSSGSKKRMDAAAREVDSQRLFSIEVDPGKGTSSFVFDEGAVIETWPWKEVADKATKQYEQWYLYMKSGDCLAYREDGRHSLGPGNQKPDEVIWLPLEGAHIVK
jgi:hypothetical protein